MDNETIRGTKEFSSEILKFADELMRNGKSVCENTPIMLIRYPSLSIDDCDFLLRERSIQENVALAAQLFRERRQQERREEEQRKINDSAVAQAMDNTIVIQQTDLRNSEFFTAIYREIVAYCHTTKSWYIWNGERWKKDDSGTIMELAKEAIKQIYPIALRVSNDDSKKRLLTHAIRSESEAKLSSMVSLAQGSLNIPYRNLDAKLNLFNCKNGTLELDTLIFREFRRQDLLTKIAGVEYIPGAECPKWRDHISLFLNGDQELIEGFQIMCGYSLLATNPEQIFNILWGGGDNGKTVIIRVLRSIFEEYNVHIAPETLMVKKFSEGPRSDIARMAGAHLITSSEAEAYKRLAIAFIKQYTGGDPITVRNLYEKEFTYIPGGKIFLATNHKPQIPEQTKAAWDRILLWPFTVSIPKDKQIKEYETHLLAEASGILNWMIEGLKKYHERSKLLIPEKVKAATKEYEAEQDVLGEWRLECTVDDPEAVTSSRDLNESHKKWEALHAEDPEHFKPMHPNRFGRLMGERYDKIHTHDGWAYEGIRLKEQQILKTGV